ncbi:ATP-binding protein [Elusimicrobiota bacterium]
MRLFMLEDDLNMTGIVAEALKPEGVEFNASHKIAGAFESLKGFSPDIIILDVNLPDGDGYNFCTQLRQDSSLSQIPVIFLTVHGDVDSRLKGFSSGGQDYIAKPFAVEELLARIRAHLAIKKQQDSLTKKIEELLIRERVKQDLIDMIVHDLKTPLGTIKLTLGMIHKTGLISDTEHGKLLTNAESATEFAMLMVNDILDLSAGKLTPEPDTIDIKLLTSKLETLFLPKFEQNKMTLTISPPAEGKQAITDQMLLFRMITNLLANALKFSEEGKSVALNFSHTENGIRVEVIDHGPGVPDDEKEKIFAKYYRTQTPTGQIISGTGIGLAFCRLTSEALKGRIWVEDGQGGGSRFIIDLPNLRAMRSKVPKTLFNVSKIKTMKEYTISCRSQLEEARAFAAQLLDPKHPEAVLELKNIAHKLAGSAGTFGFNAATDIARKLEHQLVAVMNKTSPLDNKLRETANVSIEAIAGQFGFNR